MCFLDSGRRCTDEERYYDMVCKASYVRSIAASASQNISGAKRLESRSEATPIDSMVRQFDISALYFYRNDDDALDCVDGRQRIGAIMSFVGENEDDSHNEYPFRILNEVYDDDGHPFATLRKKTLPRFAD